LLSDRSAAAGCEYDLGIADRRLEEVEKYPRLSRRSRECKLVKAIEEECDAPCSSM